MAEPLFCLFLLASAYLGQSASHAHIEINIVAESVAMALTRDDMDYGPHQPHSMTFVVVRS